MMKKKIYRIKTSTGKTIAIPMIPVDTKKIIEEKGKVCDYCPYEALCPNLPDPRDIDNPESTLIDFCAIIESEDDKKFENCYPEEGSLEEVYEDRADIVQKLIENNPMVSVHKVIESVCGGVGLCPDYNPEHTGCSDKNVTCILKQLFKNDK